MLYIIYRMLVLKFKFQSKRHIPWFPLRDAWSLFPFRQYFYSLQLQQLSGSIKLNHYIVNSKLLEALEFLMTHWRRTTVKNFQSSNLLRDVWITQQNHLKLRQKIRRIPACSTWSQSRWCYTTWKPSNRHGPSWMTRIVSQLNAQPATTLARNSGFAFI